MPLFGRLRRRLNSRGTRRRSSPTERRHRPATGSGTAAPAVVGLAAENTTTGRRSILITDGPDEVDDEDATTTTVTTRSSPPPPRYVEIHAVPAGRLSPISAAEDSIYSLTSRVVVETGQSGQNKENQNVGSQDFCSEQGLFINPEDEDGSSKTQRYKTHDTAWNIISSDDHSAEEDTTIVSMAISTTLKESRKSTWVAASQLTAQEKSDSIALVHPISRRVSPRSFSRSVNSGSTTRECYEEWETNVLSTRSSDGLGTILELEVEPILESNNSSENVGFKPEQRVLIEKGKHAKKQGCLVARKNKNSWIVRLMDDDGQEVVVRETSLRHDTNQTTATEVSIASDSTSTSPVTRTAFQDESSSEMYPAGSRVFIHKGLHKNQLGTVIARKNKGTLAVRLDHKSSPIGVRESSLRVSYSGSSTPSEAPPTPSDSPLNLQNRKKSAKSRPLTDSGKAPPLHTIIGETDPAQGRVVTIIKGIHKNERARIVGEKNKRTYEVVLESNQKTVGVLMSSVDWVGTGSSSTTNPPRVKSPVTSRKANHVDEQNKHSTRSNSTVRSERSLRMLLRSRKDRAGSKPLDGPGALISAFGGKTVEVREGNDQALSFLEHMLPGRLINVTRKLGKAKEFPLKMEVAGREYELFTVKIDDDKSGGGPVGVRTKVAKLVYVDVSPCANGSRFSIEDFLLGFGDFSVLDPRKISARLELFQSPARFEIPQFDPSHFCEIEETGNVGCGFIASHLLAKICDRGGLKHTELVSAIQVRLFIPSMGIFKGMLQKKDIPHGSPEIQLPPSMKKVPASRIADRSSPAYLVVCQGGIHTSLGGLNDLIGRKIQGTLNAHKTFAGLVGRKKLNDMVLTLWSSLGLSDRELKNYAKESQKPERHNHAWIVGTVDPTGALPPDHVFIPGMGKGLPEKIFVTRSPCLRQDHGRLLRTVTRQPCDMPDEDWEFLNLLPFGSIIFSRPRAGSMSMPERIASGDLDGDLYLICWDTVIVSQMNKVFRMADQPVEDDGTLRTVPSNPNWLDDARRIMTDATAAADIGALIGKLYTTSMKLARESNLKKADPDAAALADAYNEALEYKKHGRPIRVPLHLINQLPKRFRHLLTPL
jgi:RNA dependent RNA polymerase